MSTTKPKSNGPPTPRSGTPGVATTKTRQKEPTTRELASDPAAGAVRDAQMAKSFLERTLMVPKGDPYTVTSLSTALLHIAHSSGTKDAMVEGMKAVATLMKFVAQDEVVEEVACRVAECMVSPMEQLSGAIVEVKAVAAKIQQATREVREERARTLENMAAALATLEKTPTYASAAARPTPLAQAQWGSQTTQSTLMRVAMLAKGNLKACQVLINEE